MDSDIFSHNSNKLKVNLVSLWTDLDVSHGCNDLNVYLDLFSHEGNVHCDCKVRIPRGHKILAVLLHVCWLPDPCDRSRPPANVFYIFFVS